jgi:hypothetical protein
VGAVAIAVAVVIVVVDVIKAFAAKSSAEASTWRKWQPNKATQSKSKKP